MSPRLRWYALYTKAQCERIVSKRLQAKGLETYVPIITVNRSHGNTLRSPFFAGYLFVRLDLNTDDLSSVRWTPGLWDIVSFDERPAVVPDEVITLIRERLATLGQGDKVKGRQGEDFPCSLSPPLPFSLSQFEAVFEQTLKPAERALVLIHYLGRISKLQVDVEDLETAGAARVTG